MNLQGIYEQFPAEFSKAADSYRALMLRGIPLTLKESGYVREAIVYDSMLTTANGGLAGAVEACGPNVWLNAHLLYSETAAGRALGVEKAARRLVSATYDSLWARLPQGMVVELDAGDDSSIFLPELGCKLQSRNVGIGRSENGPMVIENSFSIPLQRWARYSPLNCRAIDGTPALLMGEPEHTLYDDFSGSRVKDLVQEMESFLTELQVSFGLIRRCGIHIFEPAPVLRWFVALKGERPDVHYSHSSSMMPGAIFVSRSSDPLVLAEAIVHECGHNRLNHMENASALVARPDEAINYSPWRNDPRPLRGVIHAIYVFAGVLGFLRAVRSVVDEASLARVESRRTLVAYRLLFALRQVPNDRQTLLSRWVLDFARTRAQEAIRELNLDPNELPSLLKAHIFTWEELNAPLRARL